ncbi:hypothetical protein ACH3XW_30480 [Acanthocheilonema viteae]
MVGSQDTTHASTKFEVIKQQINRRRQDNGGPSREILLTERSGMRMACDRNYVYVTFTRICACRGSLAFQCSD